MACMSRKSFGWSRKGARFCHEVGCTCRDRCARRSARTSFASLRTRHSPPFCAPVQRQLLTGLKAGSTSRSNRHVYRFSRGGMRTVLNAGWKANSSAVSMAYRRSEEHPSELQSLMRNSYARFRLKKKKKNHLHKIIQTKRLRESDHTSTAQ